MGLTVWNSVSDLFSHVALENNMIAIDQHNHTPGEGTQIPTAGIADGAITAAKLAAGAISNLTGGQLATGSITSTQIADGTLVAADVSPTGGIGLANYRVTTSSISASVGDWVIANGTGLGIYLPAPAANATVTVTSGPLCTSPNSPVKLWSNSGNQIYPPRRMNGASAEAVGYIPLGVPNTTIMFRSDGTYWYVVSGEPDTGWLTNTAATGAGAGSAQATYCRLRGDMFYLAGYFEATGSGLAANTIFATTPTGFTTPSGTIGSWAVYSPVASVNGVANNLYLQNGSLAFSAAVGASDVIAFYVMQPYGYGYVT